MKSIFIPIHSFVDLITNSSSETYISADVSTVNTVKAMITHILKGGGSDKTADDLFEVSLSNGGLDGIDVVAKDGTNVDLVQAAKVLSNLTALFDITSQCSVT